MNDSDSLNLSLSRPRPLEDIPQGRHFSPFFALVIVCITYFVIALAIHGPGLSSPMIYDSDGWIYRKADVYEHGGLFAVIGFVPVRPLFMGSLYLNYLISGMDPLWFRVFNALMLAMAGGTLAWMILSLLEMPGLSVPGTWWEKRVVALASALLFVVHPLQTFVVLYIWQRGAIMACVFFFAAVAVFLAARSGRWNRTMLAYGLVGLLFFAGLTSKENVATLPIMLLAAELMLCPEPLKSWPRKTLFIVLLTAPAFFLYMFMTHQLHGPESVVPSNPLNRLQGFYELGGLRVVQVILTECRVFFSYLMMIMLPFWHGMQLLQPQVISESLWNPPSTAMAVGGLAALLGSAGRLCTRKPVAAFGMLFAVVTVAPESLCIPQYLFFGHRAILPMAGVMIVGAVVVLHVLQWTRDLSIERLLRPVCALLLLIAAVSLGALTVSQARQWTPLEFWRAAYAHVPRTSARVETTSLSVIPVNLGAVLIDSGEYAEAVTVLREASRLDPESPMVRLNLGLALCKSGAAEEGIAILKTLVEQSPRLIPAWVMLAHALIDKKQMSEGISWLRKGIALNPDNLLLRTRLANALIGANNLPEAVRLLNSIAEANPADAEVRVQMGRVMSKMDNWLEAVRQFTIALSIDPGSFPAMQGLMFAQRQLREIELTLERCRNEVQAQPESVEAHFRLANALLGLGDAREAIPHFQKALVLKPEHVEATIALGTALLREGRNAEAIQPLKKAVAIVKDNAELHYALGLALKQEGHTTDAVQELQRALAIDPAHPDVRAILKDMRQATDQPASENARHQ